MSLYGMLHGQNHLTDVLLAMIGLTKAEAGRFRDIYLDGDGSKIILYTRNGGGNRECWHLDDDDKNDAADWEACDCPGCIIGYRLPKHPLYVRDWDDDFDSTYAYIEFNVPPECADLAAGLATGEMPQTVHEKFEASMERIKAMSADELRSDPAIGPVVSALESAMKLANGGA